MGVRRSCETAASAWVRSATRPWMRSCMAFSARPIPRVSSGPTSGTGTTAPRPIRPVARVNSRRGPAMR